MRRLCTVPEVPQTKSDTSAVPQQFKEKQHLQDVPQLHFRHFESYKKVSKRCILGTPQSRF